MKSILYILITVLLMSTTENENRTECYPDKGIKTAKTFAKLKNETKNAEGYQEVQFDRLGRPLFVKNTTNETENRYEYEDDKLLYIITKSALPDFFFQDEKDSLRETSSPTIDTTVILKNDASGRATEMKHPDGTTSILTYEGCDKQINTILGKKGAIVQEFEQIKKNGLLTKTTWTPHQPVKSSRISTYFGYKFNTQGHWVKRQYQHQGGQVAIETRELTYY